MGKLAKAAKMASSVSYEAPAAEDLTIEILQAKLSSYLPAADLSIVNKAYEYAKEAHGPQIRRSGAPYVTHPLATASLLADMHLDLAAIVASLLHDVPEDTSVGLHEVKEEFGAEVAYLVDGVTKLSRINWSVIEDSKKVVAKPSEEDVSGWAENLRKMFLAMAEDIRVVLIKLADRLHNMRTLGYLPVAKRKQIAQETLEIYAPLASRLGMWQFKWQLEDLAFRHLEPAKYKEIAGMIAGRRASRERYISRVMDILRDELQGAGIKVEINGRPKHIYSIYRKMQRRGVDFAQIYDLLAVRVLVEEIHDCYSALGVVHALWHPLPGQFDDYIAMPKESLYQSLHTTVLGPDGHPLEIQIRTQAMHRLAEYGVAAHWRYKEGGKRDVKFEEKVAWLRQLMDWHKDIAGGAQEFVESLKTDIFQDQVYVFTPRGEIKELPTGATPLDFAYRVHTDVGHRCIGAKISGRLVPLDYQLKTGDVVEILTTKGPKGPSRDWLNPNLNYVKTIHARDKIRQWFKRQQRDENIARGRDMLEKEFNRFNLGQEKLEEVAQQFKYERLDDFLAAVGYGEINPHHVALKLANPAREEDTLRDLPVMRAPLPPPAEAKGITVMGVGDLLTRLARCCSPVPGDDIIGYITRGKGVTIHRRDCPNVRGETEKERMVKVDWGQFDATVYPVAIRIEAWDRDGLLRDIAAVVSEENMNMAAASAVTYPDRTATIRATLEVSSVDRLSRILAKLESIRGIIAVKRDTT